MRIGNLCKTPMGKEYSGKGGVACLEHPIPCDEGQIVRACLFKASQIRHGCVRRAHKLSADHIVDLFQ
jgi:hypothetical protein